MPVLGTRLELRVVLTEARRELELDLERHNHVSFNMVNAGIIGHVGTAGNTWGTVCVKNISFS